MTLLVLELYLLEVYYLINSEMTKRGIKSLLYNPSNGRMKEILDTRYKPFFFIPHPLSRDDEKTVLELGATTRMVEKQNLFTSKRQVRLAKNTYVFNKIG